MYPNGSMAFDDSHNAYGMELGITYQPFNALTVSANPSYTINNDKLQFVENIDFNGTPRYLNGKIEQRTLGMSLRVNYTINPDLTIQYWGQPFVSRGRYSNFKLVTDPLAKDFDDRITAFNDDQISLTDEIYSVDENLDGNVDYNFNDPDFSLVQFRSNLVFRWEYIPGSEIYLVWSQDISRSGNPQAELFQNLEDNIFGEKPKNIFLIKVTYRFVR